MARRRRKRSQSSAATVFAIVGLSAIILGLIGAYGFFRWEASQTVALNPDTFCPISGAVSATAVLLDLTDPVATSTLDDVKNKFEKLMQDVPEGGQLTIFALTERANDIVPKISVCNPGNGANVDPMTSNPRLAKKRWEKSYRKPLEEFIEGLSNPKAATRSPIMAGIQQIELKQFDSAEATNGPKRLIVVSDMIEHTDAYSFYRQGASFPDYQRSPAHDMFRTHLNGVDVTILLIQRLNSPVGTDNLVSFWGSWLQANKASRVHIIRLVGAK